MSTSAFQSDRTPSRLVIRETTLLPNRPGFGPLMALIFCPTMEVKRDKDKNRFISIITGLGYNSKTNRPIFEEHDCVFNLDVEIDESDFRIVSNRNIFQQKYRLELNYLCFLQINQIRYCLDTILFSFVGQENGRNISEHEKATLTIKMKQLLIR